MGPPIYERLWQGRAHARRSLRYPIIFAVIFTIVSTLAIWNREELSIQYAKHAPWYNDPPEEAFFDERVAEEIYLGDSRVNEFFTGASLNVLQEKDQSLDYTKSSPLPFRPYPGYNTEAWRAEWRGDFEPCAGPRGLLNDTDEETVSVYHGSQPGFPKSMLGSADTLGLDTTICYERSSRLGPYGYGGAIRSNFFNGQGQAPSPWNTTDWGRLQRDCVRQNQNRFLPRHRTDISSERSLDDYEWSGEKMPSYKKRSAIILRTWDDFKYKTNDFQYIRSMITELSLRSGGEYEVFLLVHVKDTKLPIFSDDKVYQDTVNQCVPPEFANMTVLFNTPLLQSWYPKVKEHQPMLQHFQPVQYFSRLYPEFDFYWQFEMDSRYTGHHYHFLETISEWAKEQPRKYLWERNARFYLPAVHGSYQEFTDFVEQETGKDGVWGAPSLSDIAPVGPSPPWKQKDDKYEWGVGEDADLITFFPMIDVSHTGWLFNDRIYNFRTGEQTPRRASPGTMSRLSSTLLDAIHDGQTSRGLGFASEMTHTSFALLHGLKAVYVPHPVYEDGRWQPEFVDLVFNPGPPDNPSGGPDSWINLGNTGKVEPLCHHWSFNWAGWFADKLYRRWLGYVVDEEGGEEWEAQHGRMCLPGVFLHPVKRVGESGEASA